MIISDEQLDSCSDEFDCNLDVDSGENFANLVNSESPAIVVPVTKSLSKRKMCSTCEKNGSDGIDVGKGKCMSCIGMPIDELNWPSLGKCLKILLRICSPLEVAQIMKAEKECMANQLRPEQLIVNGKQLHDDELAEIFGMILECLTENLSYVACNFSGESPNIGAGIAEISWFKMHNLDTPMRSMPWWIVYTLQWRSGDGYEGGCHECGCGGGSYGGGCFKLQVALVASVVADPVGALQPVMQPLM
ncbi:hypothetical protein AgCh_023503 [Apium graveolens]